MPKRRTQIERPKLTPKRLKEAYRLNRVFDLRMKGLSEARIAKRTGVGYTQALEDLELLKKFVGEKTAEKLKNPIRPSEKPVMKIPTNLLEKIAREEAERKRTRESQEAKRKRTRERIRKWLEEHPLRVPTLSESGKELKRQDFDAAQTRKFGEYAKSTPGEIMEEIIRIDKQLKGVKTISEANILASERNALTGLLSVY